MPLKKGAVGEAIAAIPSPPTSALEASYAAIRSRPVEEPEQDDYRLNEFSHSFSGYTSDMERLIERFDSLSGDVDIHQALVTIRNAERAIKARAEEILGG